MRRARRNYRRALFRFRSGGSHILESTLSTRARAVQPLLTRRRKARGCRMWWCAFGISRLSNFSCFLRRRDQPVWAQVRMSLILRQGVKIARPRFAAAPGLPRSKNPQYLLLGSSCNDTWKLCPSLRERKGGLRKKISSRKRHALLVTLRKQKNPPLGFLLTRKMRRTSAKDRQALIGVRARPRPSATRTQTKPPSITRTFSREWRPKIRVS